MKRIVVFFVIVLFAVSVDASTVPVTGRSWNFINTNLIISKHFSWRFTPGVRYEFDRNPGTAKNLYMTEFFTGPVYTTHFNKIKVEIPFQYYYMGFPNSMNAYHYNHNFDIRPIFKYKIGKFLFYNKFVFHNTFFANIYQASTQQFGYSLLFKYFVRIQYFFNKKWSVLATEDPVWGIIEDDGARANTGIGFSEQGFDINRFFVGFSYRVSKNVVIIPRYCFELKYKNDVTGNKTLREKDNYLFLTLQYTYMLRR